MEKTLGDSGGRGAQHVWLADSVSIHRNRLRRFARFALYAAFVTLIPLPCFTIVDACIYGKSFFTDYPWLQFFAVAAITNAALLLAALPFRDLFPRLAHAVELGADDIQLDCGGSNVQILPLSSLECIKLNYDRGVSLEAVKLAYRDSFGGRRSITLSAHLLPLTEIWPVLDAAMPPSEPRKTSSTRSSLLVLILVLSAFAFFVLDGCAIFFFRMWLYRGI